MRSLRRFLTLGAGDIQTLNPGIASSGTGTFTSITTVNLTATGIISPAQGPGILGTTTNNSANPGSIGEFVTATVASPGSALTNATTLNVTSISLTGGDWDVSTFVNFLETGATGTQLACGPSLVTGTLPTQAGGAGLGTDALALNDAAFAGLSGTQQIDSGPVRVSINATTTVFLTAQATFSVGTVSAFGTIRARRVR